MADDGVIEVKKKTYSKPVMTEVKLVPQESMLNLCKEGNPLEGQCTSTCASVGSIS